MVARVSVAFVLRKTECCQQHVRPLLDHFEGLLDLGHDLRRIHRPDIRNFPCLDSLSDRVYPILAEVIVLALHEHEDGARPDERGGRLLPRGGRKAFNAAFAKNARRV